MKNDITFCDIERCEMSDICRRHVDNKNITGKSMFLAPAKDCRDNNFAEFLPEGWEQLEPCIRCEKYKRQSELVGEVCRRCREND